MYENSIKVLLTSSKTRKILLIILGHNFLTFKLNGNFNTLFIIRMKLVSLPIFSSNIIIPLFKNKKIPAFDQILYGEGSIPSGYEDFRLIGVHLHVNCLDGDRSSGFDDFPP